MAAETTLPPAEASSFPDLLGYAPQGIASRLLAKTPGGNATLFAFERGQGLTEHTSPFDALVFVLEGAMTLSIGGKEVRAGAGTVTRMPAAVPHALVADERTRMLLVMLRDPKSAT
ncbi:MAG TPA: cupin domain-containing protein [Anaeromyxobacteraceae bacterium]|nr:cupin domain-containing protein [Anaeromyxobacteraceae bacterium]